MSKMKNVLFISLGCDKNLVDSEKMLGLLSEAGYTIVEEEEQAAKEQEAAAKEKEAEAQKKTEEALREEAEKHETRIEESL